ncbi:MAG: beta-propeller domain-containing protein [Lachnospiraceae bacterium]|nr:beta-propeller domain-containing protein [Lachnospiraceae bacterium]
MKNREDILSHLKEEAETLEIPESIAPENMQKFLKQHGTQKAAKRQETRKTYQKILAMAACLCVVIGAIFFIKDKVNQPDAIAREDVIDTEIETLEIAEKKMEYPKVSYHDIYASMSEKWEETERFVYGVLEEPAEDIMFDGVVAEAGVVEESVSEADKQMNAVADMAESEYGTTNVQTVGVDEADVVKNDGRYLYQKARIEEENESNWVIQIIDTKDGLKEVSRIENIYGIKEFYVWEDVLVVVEEKYLDDTENAAKKGIYACVDVLYNSNSYQEITFFDIKDRSQPKEIKAFTLQGEYASSRISDGYFYGFGKYYANPGEGEEDYDAYIPTLDGTRLEESRIYLPADNEATSYLVLTAVDLRNPTEFTDTTGIVSGADMYYVSGEHIYVADMNGAEMQEGWSANSTSILKFSYGDGKFALQAKGEVKGQLDSSFSMDEYKEHLRVVSTVWEYKKEYITDDRTGEGLGYEITDERQTNALYVLDESLELVGKIEGLAENEQIYSARFMGDVGYFVTFRQTDPLFTVDLSDPKNPKILSELKISGFSEYLHIYGEDRLLGIGMETDEETGAQQGMKLSMFDTSDKTDVEEITKLHLEDYDYSEALYNHRAVMISTGKNLFGFEAEGFRNREYQRHYLVYSYENDEFVQKLKIDTKDADGGYYTSRGTFIGDVFYLLSENGSVRSYNLNSGAQLESLEP